MKPARRLLTATTFLLPWLAGCEQLGIETPQQELARYEAEGKAIGGSCRQAGRALEDCYQINPKAPKAAIFAGWRDMDAYMRENKIEEVKPLFPMKPPDPKKKKTPLGEDGEGTKGAPGEDKAAEGAAPATSAAPVPAAGTPGTTPPAVTVPAAPPPAPAKGGH